ncbi:MAG: metallophosphoesterase [Actinobacteria bacterium]|nr:metallophosphoesterase [Actinomycetota bacterium]
MAYVATWLALSVVAATVVFFHSSAEVSLASHDAVITPTTTGQVVLRTGPVLPDLRIASGSPFGVDVRLGKTDATSTSDLVQRYAVIAVNPDGPEAKVREALADLAFDAVVRGAVLGLVPLLVWLLIGRSRRRELGAAARSRAGGLTTALVALMVLGLWQPWLPDDDTVDAGRDWMALADFLGPTVPVPEELDGIEVRGDVTTDQTRRLIESAVDTYDKSRTFYASAAEAAARLDLRRPEDGETVVLLVSDRHDNIQMDAVARAIGDAAGATAVFDAGDDTSTGKTWEAFSLDSLTAAFDDGPYAGQRYGVAGNHDHGTFVRSYLADHGWTMLDGEPVDGPADVRLLGVDDPRSSGLGSWRDETGLSFDEVGSRLADAACAAEEAGERIGTVLVHDANLGDEALERGCVDLVVGGHLHVQEWPDRVVGDDGDVGWTFTTGTTGGAAYAIAIGSKIKRTAQVSLLTYRDGRPVGIQAVQLETNGRYRVERFVELDLAPVS